MIAHACALIAMSGAYCDNDVLPGRILYDLAKSGDNCARPSHYGWQLAFYAYEGAARRGGRTQPDGDYTLTRECASAMWSFII